ERACDLSASSVRAARACAPESSKTIQRYRVWMTMDSTERPHPCQELLAAFAAGALSPQEAAAIECHLDGCSACVAVLEALSEDSLTARLRNVREANQLDPGATADDAHRDPLAQTLSYVVLKADGSNAGPDESLDDCLETIRPGVNLRSRYQLEQELGRGS